MPAIDCVFLRSVPLCLLLAACDAPDPMTRLQAQQDAADPPQLWSVQVVDASARPGDQPIRMCTDRLIRTGFLNQYAATDAAPCLPELPPVRTPTSVSMRCALGGHTFAVYNSAKGDMQKDFQVTFTMRSIGAEDVNLRQTRRYRNLGPCPTGWRIGDATDRYGRPTTNAMR